MNHHSTNSIYAFSSAFDLKASYQRNMITSMSAVTALAFVIAGSIWLSDTYIIVPEKLVRMTHREQSKPWSSHEFHRPPAEPEARAASSASQQEIGIPEPVADDGVSDVLIQTDVHTTGTADSAVGANSSVISSFTGTAEYFPTDTEFVIVEKPAAVVTLQQPDYPRLAQRTGLTGIVWIKTLVGRDGLPRESKIGRTSGFPVLDQAALDAAQRSIFSPAIQNGNPVAMWVTYKVVFELER